jgi:hypothetical protein
MPSVVDQKPTTGTRAIEGGVGVALGVETAVGIGVGVVEGVGTGALVGGSTGVGPQASAMQTIATVAIHDRGIRDAGTDRA